MGASGFRSLLPEPQGQLGLPLSSTRRRGVGRASSRRARARRDREGARGGSQGPDPGRPDRQLQRRRRHHARAGAAAGRSVSGEPPRFSIADLDPGDEALIRQTAELLVEGFREEPEAWPDVGAALGEVHESLGEGRISRVALDESGTVLGWIGGIPSYGGIVWELHPLVVRPEAQRRGVGRALVADLEARVTERGGLTLWLGTDDESGMTSLSGVDLYPDVLEHLANIQNLRGHPYEFYARLGFSIIGAMPDANGFGKPDIYMAKRCR